MKKLLKITGIIVGSFLALVIIIVLLTLLSMSLSGNRSAKKYKALAGAFSGDFSLWPEPAGLAATGDSALVWQHADIARQEYLATGIRVALHPDSHTAVRDALINEGCSRSERRSAL